MSIGMSPLKQIYGYDASTFIDRIFGDSRDIKSKDWIEESQDILKVFKDNLHVSQNKQNKYADQHRVERHLQVKYLVYLRL